MEKVFAICGALAMRELRIFKVIMAFVLTLSLAAPFSVFASEPDESSDTVSDVIQEDSQAEEPVEEAPEVIYEASEDQVPEENTDETTESDSVAPVSVPSFVNKEPVISVVFPSISDEGDSPLDFLIDPQQLVYLTDAAKYGGGRVEEGATMLFRNHDGNYDFSRYSDRFTIKNQSDVPVNVKITASMSNLDEIDMVNSSNFGDREDCSMYMAVVDDEGNERPLIDNGLVTVEVQMNNVDTYSFGLVGACNPNGSWDNMQLCPRVSLTWEVEPVITEEVTEEEPVESEILHEVFETVPVTEEQEEIDSATEEIRETVGQDMATEDNSSEANKTEDKNSVDNTAEDEKAVQQDNSEGSPPDSPEIISDSGEDEDTAPPEG